MTQKPAVQAVKQKGNEFVKAMLDLLILALLMGGSGFGGYFWGIHERLAPVQDVPPGTANALPPLIAPAKHDSKHEKADGKVLASAGAAKAGAHELPAASARTALKYWISSSGVDYTGYSITVKVNDTPVDNFFGPGKTVDITRFVKSGDNEVAFEAKSLGAQYNKHSGDANAALTVQLVCGAHVQDDFKPSEVALTYTRNAAENEDFNDSKHFSAK